MKKLILGLATTALLAGSLPASAHTAGLATCSKVGKFTKDGRWATGRVKITNGNQENYDYVDVQVSLRNRAGQRLGSRWNRTVYIGPLHTEYRRWWIKFPRGTKPARATIDHCHWRDFLRAANAWKERLMFKKRREERENERWIEAKRYVASLPTRPICLEPVEPVGARVNRHPRLFYGLDIPAPKTGALGEHFGCEA